MCGRAFRAREKGDFSIGKTKVGKGSKVMRVANGNSLPIGLHIDNAQPHESALAEPILATVKVPQQRCDPSTRPRELVADKTYDGRVFRQQLRRRGIKPAIPTVVRRHRRRPEQGRPIRTGPNYRHRWKGERCFGWMANYRRLVVRYERYVEHYRAYGV
jgi:transposase